MAAKPKKSFESIEQNGLKALELMDRHRDCATRSKPRVPPAKSAPHSASVAG